LWMVLTLLTMWSCFCSAQSALMMHSMVDVLRLA
jgi:hypothetical protein